MSNKIFIDTSAWLALIIEAEPKHKLVDAIIKEVLKQGAAMFTSNDVINETFTRLLTHLGYKKTENFYKLFWENIQKSLLIQLWADEIIQEEAWQVIKKFRDHKLSFTDATSVVLMKRFNIDSIVTLDSDFIKIGLPVLPTK